MATIATRLDHLARLTQRWRFGVTQAAPITSRIAIVLQLERDIVSSNLLFTCT